jgi:Tfp pilus assembly protein PilV
MQLRRDETGMTLPEVLVAMILGLLIAGSALLLMQSAMSSATASTRRQTATSDAATAAFRITHDLRVATQAVVQSPQVLDVVTWQRATPGAALTSAQVRYDCSTNNRCVRYRCAGAVISGNSCPSAAVSGIVLTGLTNTDVFTPQSNGTAITSYPASTPATPSTAGGLDFVALRLSVRMDGKLTGPMTTQHAKSPLEFLDGAQLANFDN